MIDEMTKTERKNAIRYMSLRASILKLNERLQNDIDHYDRIEDGLGLYEVGKLNEMRRINEYLIVALDKAEDAGRNVEE